MPGLYDSYQLSNSKFNRQYTGNTLNELTKVSDVMQDRYDASAAGIEGLDEFIKNAKALPKDKALLEERSKVYNEELKGYSKRPDLENITRDVSRSGRRFANEYKNFANRYQGVAVYRDELEKKVDSGKLSRDTADLRLAKSIDLDQGLKYDKTTGKFDNTVFQGEDTANEVDLPAWVKKVAGDIASSKNGSLVETPQGDYFIKRGSSMERITSAQINSAIKQGLAMDPEVRAHIHQAGELAGWKAGKTKLEDLPANERGQLGLLALQSGRNPQELIGAMGAKNAQDKLVSSIYGLAQKYAFQKTESSSEYDGFTVQGQHKANKPYDNQMLELSTLSPGTGVKIESGADFEALRTDTKNGITNAVQAYSDALTKNKRLGKGVVQENGRFFRKNNDGTQTEITDEIKPLQDNIKNHQQLMDYHNQIDKDARTLSGFDKESQNPVLLKKAQAAYDNVMGIGSSVSNTFGHTETKESIAQKKQTAQQAYDNVMKASPAYKEYVENIKQRLANPAESSTILGITSPEEKKGWSDILTGLSSNLGLKEGALAFTVGSGPNQGEQLSGNDYDQIKGDVDVIGVSTDTHGNVILVARANKEVKGKKIKGKDLLLQVPQTSVDSYLDGKVNDGDVTASQVHNLRVESGLKQQLDNKYRQAKMYIPDTNVAADIKQEGQKWIITFPEANGNTKRVVALSYQGISDALHQASADYKAAK